METMLYLIGEDYFWLFPAFCLLQTILQCISSIVCLVFMCEDTSRINPKLQGPRMCAVVILLDMARWSFGGPQR